MKVFLKGMLFTAELILAVGGGTALFLGLFLLIAELSLPVWVVIPIVFLAICAAGGALYALGKSDG